MSTNMTRARYIPGKILYTTTETTFGAKETDLPDLYKKGLPNGVVVQVDCLQSLQTILDKALCEELRNQLYVVTSGSNKIITDNESYRYLFEYLYVNFDKFRDHVDSSNIFKPEGVNFITAVISPLRAIIDSEIDRVIEMSAMTSGTLLMVTHDYVYILYKHGVEPHKFSHMEVY